MGYYTEIIFGASLKGDTPKNIIDTLRYVANGPEQNIDDKDPVIVYDKELIHKYHLYSVMKSGSYYFGVCDPVSKMWFNDTDKRWILSFRSNCKNAWIVDENNKPVIQYLEGFVKWIKPYIKYGSGGGDIYAIITTEDGVPILYGKRKTYKAESIDNPNEQ